MTKGQKAMAVAMVYPKPKKTGRGKKSSETEDISSGRLSMARKVLRYSIDGDLASPNQGLTRDVSRDGVPRTGDARPGQKL